jgi:hypothetical protein
MKCGAPNFAGVARSVTNDERPAEPGLPSLFNAVIVFQKEPSTFKEGEVVTSDHSRQCELVPDNKELGRGIPHGLWLVD